MEHSSQSCAAAHAPLWGQMKIKKVSRQSQTPSDSTAASAAQSSRIIIKSTSLQSLSAVWHFELLQHWYFYTYLCPQRYNRMPCAWIARKKNMWRGTGSVLAHAHIWLFACSNRCPHFLPLPAVFSLSLSSCLNLTAKCILLLSMLGSLCSLGPIRTHWYVTLHNN